MRVLLGAMLVATAAFGCADRSLAAPLSSSELTYDRALLGNFNLISLGNYNTNNETEGRILVGGNASVNGSTNVCFNGGCNGNTSFGGTGIQGYGALTVFGNVTGGFTVMNGGDIDVRGNVGASTYSLNGKGSLNVGGTTQSGTVIDSPTSIQTSQSSLAATVRNPASGYSLKTSVAINTVFPFGSNATADFGKPLSNLSQGIAALPGSPGVTAQALPANQSNSAFLAGADYTANGKTYGVVTTTLANLVAEGQNFGGVQNGSGNNATFVIVTGDVTNATLPTLNSLYSNVLYDFVDAKSLIASGGFNGSILAPLATLTQSGVINGSLIVASLYQSAELHQGNLFTGDLTGLMTTTSRVPEPASLALLGAGLAALATLRRRK